MKIMLYIVIAVTISVAISTTITIYLIKRLGERCIKFAYNGDLKLMNTLKEIVNKL